MKALIKPVVLLAIIALSLFEFALEHLNIELRVSELPLFQVQRILLICSAVWCCTFLFLTFRLNDLLLVGFLIIALVALFTVQARNGPVTGAFMLLLGQALGRTARMLLKPYSDRRRRKRKCRNMVEIRNSESEMRDFLLGLVLLLAFSSSWHLHMTKIVYHGPRWVGLWNNPNVYGMLTGVGTVLAIGLLAATGSGDGRWKIEEGKERRKAGSGTWNWRRLSPFFFLRKSAKSAEGKVSGDAQGLACRGRVVPILLFTAAGMMSVGLLFSYSRGAWVGVAIGLLYLAKVYGRFKWRYLFPIFLIAAAVVWIFWNTPHSAPWYLQRLDFSRGSIQHRLAAWKDAFEMMQDHPFGVGWGKTLETYYKNYSPPLVGAVAISTNDYLMLGTQLGWAGLACFLAYVALCFRNQKAEGRRQNAEGEKAGARGQRSEIRDQTAESDQSGIRNSEFGIKTACRAGALAMLVAFWFDGGLFKLATASVFWILLELGNESRNGESEGEKLKR